MNIQYFNGCNNNDYVWYDVSYHEDVNDERHAVWVRPRRRATEKVYFNIILMKSHTVIMAYFTNDSTIDLLNDNIDITNLNPFGSGEQCDHPTKGGMASDSPNAHMITMTRQLDR